MNKNTMQKKLNEFLAMKQITKKEFSKSNKWNEEWMEYFLSDRPKDFKNREIEIKKSLK